MNETARTPAAGLAAPEPTASARRPPGTLRRIARLLANELMKFRRQWWVWIVVVLPVLIATVMPLGIGFDRELRRLAPGADNTAVTGYQCLSTTLDRTLYIGSFALLLFAVQLLSGERAPGHLRDTFAAPVRRYEVVISKWLTLLLAMLGFYALVIAAATASTAYLFDFGDYLEEGVLMVSGEELRDETVRALYLFLPPCVALLSLGLFISSLTSNPGISAAAAIVTVGILEVSKGLLSGGYPVRYRSYLFNNWLPSPFEGDAYLDGLPRFAEGFSDALWDSQGRELALNFLVPSIYAVVFLSATIAVVSRKDYTE